MDNASDVSKNDIAQKIDAANPEVTLNQAVKSAQVVKEVDNGTDSSLDVVYRRRY